MSKFYCREDELRKMNKRYKGDKFECIVIYGRRRVGKTALINEFCKDKGDCIRLRYTGIQLRVERTYGTLTKI